MADPAAGVLTGDRPRVDAGEVLRPRGGPLRAEEETETEEARLLAVDVGVTEGEGEDIDGEGDVRDRPRWGTAAAAAGAPTAGERERGRLARPLSAVAPTVPSDATSAHRICCALTVAAYGRRAVCSAVRPRSGRVEYCCMWRYREVEAWSPEGEITL